MAGCSSSESFSLLSSAKPVMRWYAFVSSPVCLKLIKGRKAERNEANKCGNNISC